MSIFWLIRICNANSLCFSDKMLLPNDTYTFISSSHSTTSWLDHILSTSSGHSLLQDVHVKGDYISSDHLPLCFNVIVNNAIDCVYYSSSDDNNNNMSSFNWNGATDHDLYRYSLSTKSQLSKLSIPLDALRCSDVSCTLHQQDIDNFYYSIVNTVNGCIKQCIPLHRHSKHSIVGWNDEVKHYYSIARTEFKYWKQNGMPRSGHIFREMSSARARFKYSLRQCRLDEQCISSENLASSMQCHDLNNFWKNISLLNKSKSTLSNCINGITGEGDIANLWKNHYSILLNSSEDDSSKDFVYDSFKNISFNQEMHVTVNEVLSLVHSLESGKSAGLDGLNGECLKYADVILSVLLSFCFTCMFKHSYLPSAMLDSVIIPLVKNKCGDLSDISNYRPIAISCIVSKIFENVILLRIEEYLWTTDNQFGFKAHHSTDLCVYALTEFIEHFKNRSTSVYLAFLDASKAFDKINHWLLFKKLIERQMPLYLVTILCYWYRHQVMFVRWGSSLSTGFRVTNGVRQGGILSPLLFNVYINDLSIRLSETGIGGSIGGKFVNHMIYADDLCVISLSSSGLQSLLNICTEYCQLHDLTFNAKKSVCMFFRSSVNKQCGLSDIFISGSICEFSNEVKYLGVMINSSFKTTIDVQRQTRNFYARANLLIRNFRYCTDNVKCYLFQSYCTSMYCCQLWFNSTKGSLKKLKTSYNSALRRFLMISKPYSASQMFVSRGILSFDELLRKSIYRFVERIENSTNSIIHACLSSSVFLYSPIRKWWSSLLYL